MPKRNSKNGRAALYRALLERGHDETCAICLEPIPTRRQWRIDGQIHTPPGPFQSGVDLEIDHIDHDPKNNTLDNLRLLCRKHNASRRGAWRKPRDSVTGHKQTDRQTDRTPAIKASCNSSCVTTGEKQRAIAARVAGDERTPPELRRSLALRLDFECWVLSELAAGAGMPYADAVNGGAYLFRCSEQTTASYLRALCSRYGPLCEETEGGERRVIKRSLNDSGSLDPRGPIKPGQK